MDIVRFWIDLDFNGIMDYLVTKSVCFFKAKREIILVLHTSVVKNNTVNALIIEIN